MNFFKLEAGKGEWDLLNFVIYECIKGSYIVVKIENQSNFDCSTQTFLFHEAFYVFTYKLRYIFGFD